MHTSNNRNTATKSRKRQRTHASMKQTDTAKKGKVSDDWRAEQFLYGFTAPISSLMLIHNFMSEFSWKALQKKILTAGLDELKLKPLSFWYRCCTFGSQEDRQRSIKMAVMQQMRDKLGKPVSWEGFGKGGGRRPPTLLRHSDHVGHSLVCLRWILLLIRQRRPSQWITIKKEGTGWWFI